LPEDEEKSFRSVLIYLFLNSAKRFQNTSRYVVSISGEFGARAIIFRSKYKPDQNVLKDICAALSDHTVGTLSKHTAIQSKTSKATVASEHHSDAAGFDSSWPDEVLQMKAGQGFEHVGEGVDVVIE